MRNSDTNSTAYAAPALTSVRPEGRPTQAAGLAAWDAFSVETALLTLITSFCPVSRRPFDRPAKTGELGARGHQGELGNDDPGRP